MAAWSVEKYLPRSLRSFGKYFFNTRREIQCGHVISSISVLMLGIKRLTIEQQ